MNQEYKKELNKIYKWYDKTLKNNSNRSGKFYLYLLQEKNQKIVDLKKESIK